MWQMGYDTISKLKIHFYCYYSHTNITDHSINVVKELVLRERKIQHRWRERCDHALLCEIDHYICVFLYRKEFVPFLVSNLVRVELSVVLHMIMDR